MSEKHLPQVLNLNQKDNLYFLVGSSGKEMATALTLENPSCQIVCFKVKISKIAQKLFNVSPIHGMIDPGGKVEIEIRCKCEQIKEFGKPIKFLIRSMFVADGTFGEDELVRKKLKLYSYIIFCVSIHKVYFFSGKMPMKHNSWTRNWSVYFLITTRPPNTIALAM